MLERHTEICLCRGINNQQGSFRLSGTPTLKRGRREKKKSKVAPSHSTNQMVCSLAFLNQAYPVMLPLENIQGCECLHAPLQPSVQHCQMNKRIHETRKPAKMCGPWEKVRVSIMGHLKVIRNGALPYSIYGQRKPNVHPEPYENDSPHYIKA